MYETHFGLRQRPFRAIPDTECYYPATSHEQALTQLLQAIEDDEGLALVTGGPGTGKTTLCHCLLNRLGDNVTTGFLTNSHFAGRAGLLQSILYDLTLPHDDAGEQTLRLRLTDFLLQNYGNGRRTVIVCDEAQALTPDLLEELRLLGNLEGRERRAFQVVLVALPGIGSTLNLAELAAFQQRLAVHAQLHPFGLHEAADYLVHQLRAVGGRAEAIISDEALEILAQGTKGVPRLLNRAAHLALSLACAADAGQLDAEAALEALKQLGCGEPDNAEERGLSGVTGPGQREPIHVAEDAVDQPVLCLDSGLENAQEEVEDPPTNPGPSRRLFVPPRRPA